MRAFLRGNTYYIKRQIEGKSIVRTLGIKRGQELLLSDAIKQMELRFLAHEKGLPFQGSSNISLIDYLEKYISQKQGKKTLKRDIQYLLVISDILSDIKLREIEKTEIEKIERELFKRTKKKKPLTFIQPTTVNRYFESLYNLFQRALEDGYVHENPVRYYLPYVEDGTRQELSMEEIKKVLLIAAEIQKNPVPGSIAELYIHDLIALGLATGMRLAEITGLKRMYITKDSIRLPITVTKHRRRQRGRSERTKEIPLSDVAREILARHTKGKGEYVFASLNQSRDPHAVIRKAVEKIRRQTGIEDFSFHRIRHTVSSYIANNFSVTIARDFSVTPI